jgi:hypothetical protein
MVRTAGVGMHRLRDPHMQVFMINKQCTRG